MQDRAFRLDFFIAVAALLVSAVSALALVYQTHVIGAQYAAAIWPYLTVTEDLNGRQQQIVLTNDGTGPALIHSAQLRVDGRTATSWAAYLAALTAKTRGARLRPGEGLAFSARGIGAGTTLRSGASLTLFSASFFGPTANATMLAALKEQMDLVFCYCSLNGSCWNMRVSTTNPVSSQIPTGACGPPLVITASTDTLASPRQQK